MIYKGKTKIQKHKIKNMCLSGAQRTLTIFNLSHILRKTQLKKNTKRLKRYILFFSKYFKFYS